MGTKQDVIFKGLTHSPSDYDCQDGELATCLNLINEDGALHPIHQPVVVDENITLNEGDTIELVHKVTHDEAIHSHYIIRKANDTWCWVEKGDNGTFHNIGLGGFHANAVTAVGNILCFVGNQDTKYGYWKQKDGIYLLFGVEDFIYDFTITNENGDVYDISAKLEEEFDNCFGWYVSDKKNSFGVYPKGSREIYNAIDSYMTKEMANNEKNVFKYLSFGVLAVKLYDGTYINISNVFTLAPSVIPTTVRCYSDTKIVAMRCGYMAHNIMVSMDAEKYKDLISSIEVFLTAPDSFLNLEIGYDITYIQGSNQKRWYFDYKRLSGNKLKEAIDNLSFYHSISIPVEHLDGREIPLENIIETSEAIPLANLYRNSIGGKYSMTFNNRLHIANVVSNCGNPMQLRAKYTYPFKSGQQFDKNDYSYKLLDDYQDPDNKVVDLVAKIQNKEGTFYFAYQTTYPIEPFITIASNEISNLTLFMHLENSYFKKDMQVYNSENTGFSFAINEVDGKMSFMQCYNVDVDTVEETEEDENGYSHGITYVKGLVRGDRNGLWQNSSVTEWQTVNSLVSEKLPSDKCANVIKVSEAENPLVFPAKNSVQVGSSIVNALAANTRPISEGQFGDAPLYAFTDEGVWVLMLGNEGTYQARQPAQRDICSNPKGILQIDDAVLFPTERGIMMQQGREAVCITDVLDDYPFDFLQIYSHSTKDKTYPNRLLALGNIPESDVQYVRFRTYLQSADMIYDYYDSRIIVFNPNYTYAYVYSLKSKMWGTMHNVFSKRVNIYPESYAINDNGRIVDVYVKEPTEDVRYFLCSRPLSLGQEDIHKTMLDCIARGNMHSIENGKCGMVLFGSNDLNNWYFISSSVNRYLRNLVGSPFKYFRIAMMGSLSVNESISRLSTDFQTRWQNKLR